MTEPSADPVAGRLAEVHRNWEVFHEADATPALLAALEAVLALHPLTGYVWRVEPCAEHLSFDTMAGEHRDCPACTVIERAGCCARCRDEHDDPARPEDCKERRAISAKLLGEGSDGG